MSLFKDEDDQAYLIHSSDINKTLYISKLSENYLELTGEYCRCFVDQSREAPAVFKRNNKYYMITSGCTGWNPNAALYAEANHILGRWELKDNPCAGPDSRKTFFAQSSFILPVLQVEDSFLFIDDRWIPENLSDSRYVWLPIEFPEEGPTIRWSDGWDLSYFHKTIR